MAQSDLLSHSEIDGDPDTRSGHARVANEQSVLDRAWKVVDRPAIPTRLPKRFPSLTGLRGAAALWVVLFHLSFVLGALFHTPLDLPLLREGYLGVDVFFMLSGFILCHVYVSAFEKYTLREHMHFLMIRLARIYPLHLVVMLALALAVWIVPAPGDPEVYPRYTFHGFVTAALLLQNWCRYPLIWNAPAWSLSAEWLAYMVFPWLLSATRLTRKAWHGLALASLSLVSLAVLFIASGHSLNSMGRGAGLLRLAAEFTAGALIYRAHALGLPARISWRWANPMVVTLLITMLLYPRAVPVAVLLFGFLILSLSEYEGFLNRIMSSRIMVFLGEISYSLYLVQALLMELVTWHLKRNAPASLGEAWMITALLVTSLLLVPILTWLMVERPARRVGRRIANRFDTPGFRRERDARPEIQGRDNQVAGLLCGPA